MDHLRVHMVRYPGALIICNIIVVGIATGVPDIPERSVAYDISSGALLNDCYSGLGGFGGSCVVNLALGSVTNNAPCSYSAALTIQVLGRYAKKALIGSGVFSSQ